MTLLWQESVDILWPVVQGIRAQINYAWNDKQTANKGYRQ